PEVTVEPVGQMVWARITHRATVLPDGRVLITGGSAFANEAPMPWAEVFDPETRRFEATGPMSVPRIDHVAVALADGRVLVAGGWRLGYVVGTKTAELWDPRTGRFDRC